MRPRAFTLLLLLGITTAAAITPVSALGDEPPPFEAYYAHLTGKDTNAQGEAIILWYHDHPVGLAMRVATTIDGPVEIRLEVVEEQSGTPITLLTYDDVGNRTSDGEPWMLLDFADPDELIDAIERGALYVNVHSIQNPSGEIRGRVRSPGVFLFDVGGPGPEGPIDRARPTFVALLHGDTDDEPYVRGAANFRLSDDGETLDATIAVSNLILYPNGWTIEATKPDGTTTIYHYEGFGRTSKIASVAGGAVEMRTLTSSDFGGAQPGSVFRSEYRLRLLVTNDAYPAGVVVGQIFLAGYIDIDGSQGGE